MNLSAFHGEGKNYRVLQLCNVMHSCTTIVRGTFEITLLKLRLFRILGLVGVGLVVKLCENYGSIMSTAGKNVSKAKTPSRSSPKTPKAQETISPSTKKPVGGTIRQSVSDVDDIPIQTGSQAPMPMDLFDTSTASVNPSMLGASGGKQNVAALACHTGTTEHTEGGLKILDVM